MAEKMWMGIPTKHMQWVPCPLIDSTITRKRFVDRVQFENGGGDVARSNAYQMEYNFSFNAPAHEVEGIDAFNKFASGYYGTGLMQVAHPATFETNMFPANWATPSLAGEGWKHPNDGTEGNVSVNTIPLLRVNYMKNPGFNSASVTPWTSSTISISVAAGQGISGNALKAIAPASSTSNLYAAPATTFPAGKILTFSAFIKTSFPIRLTADNFTTTATTIDGVPASITSNGVVTPNDGSYHRVSITGTANSSGYTNMRLFNQTPFSNTFYVDNVMVEEYGNVLDYFDGSTVDTSDWDYTWNFPSTPNDSISIAKYKIVYSGVPSKSLKFSITSSVNTPNNKVTIPIPPGYKLRLGATGVSTGSAVVQVRPILVDNTYATKENLELLPGHDSIRTNSEYSGLYYNAIEVYFTRTSSTYAALGDTLTLACMDAQLHPIGTTPAILNDHIPGEGSTGMVFADDAIVETYSYMYPPRKGISTTLVEVEAWR